MFTLKKNEIKRFYDEVILIERDDTDWTWRWYHSNRIDSWRATRKDIMSAAKEESEMSMILERMGADEYQCVHIGTKNRYVRGLDYATQVVKECYQIINPSDDALAIKKAIALLNSDLTSVLAEEDAPRAKIHRNPLDINSWIEDFRALDHKKLYKFNAPVTLPDLQKLAPRVGIIKKDSAGIYHFKESHDKTFAQDVDQKSCLKQLVFGGCALIAESAPNGKYHIIYSDLAREGARAKLAVLTLVTAVYLLPNTPAEKKKLLLAELDKFYQLEKKKVNLKSVKKER